MHLKTDKVDLKKPLSKKIFSIFFQSTHQVGMKNVVKCYKDFFGYFNALKTHGVGLVLIKINTVSTNFNNTRPALMLNN